MNLRLPAMVFSDTDGFLNALVSFLERRKEKGSVILTFKRSEHLLAVRKSQREDGQCLPSYGWDLCLILMISAGNLQHGAGKHQVRRDAGTLSRTSLAARTELSVPLQRRSTSA